MLEMLSTKSAHDRTSFHRLGNTEGQGSRYTGALGIPSTKPRISVRTGFLTVGCCLAFAVAVATVQIESLAVELGQTYQLVVIGLMLSLMWYCAQRQIQLALLSIEARHRCPTKGTSMLQNLDAILTLNPLGSHVNICYRVVIGVLLLLPLGLSAGYKIFSGGYSNSPATVSQAYFGITGPPGTQNIGYGVSLFVNTTLPWFDDPGFDRVYGFNMYVASENTTAMLDGPMPSFVSAQQKGLRPGQSLSLTAEVTATVCNLSSSLDQSRAWLNDTFQNVTGNSDINTAFWQFFNTADQFVGLMTPYSWDFSTVWMSWWSVKQQQNFGSQVRQYNLTRQRMIGTWDITANSVSLRNATFLHSITNNQTILNFNLLGAGNLYIFALTEYDYLFRNLGYWRKNNNSKYLEFVKTDSTLVAAMIWSRITSLDGPEGWGLDTSDPAPIDPNLYYHVTNVTQQSTPITLERSTWGLFLILATNPLLLAFSLLFSAALYYDSPIGEGFGLSSILSAANPATLSLLDGAGLSGQLKEKVHVRFNVIAKHEEMKVDESDYLNEPKRIKIVFGADDERNDHVRMSEVYG
ncbi:hypothetical protein EDD37DRAFT_614017 [Exophiala viscosa]|uniref:uncharacterized protein n=1 Tax=Exophiala viscosa TaxID=2486360 RepID=UPI0021953ACF|nr:hypothetical protein EDD37DRAFT_614017 [Exophiala viscosa]